MLSIGHRRDQAHVRSTIIDVSVPTPGGGFPAPFATTARFVRTFWTKSFGPRLCGCSKIRASSRTRSSGGSRQLARLIRPNVAKEGLRRDVVRIRKSIDRLLTAYQEGLLPIEELRERMPQLRRRQQASNAELQAIADQSVTRTAYLRLAETLNTFLTRLRSSASALDVSERQRIVRLLVKEVLVGDDQIIIRHCIPLPNRSGDRPPEGGVNTAPPGTEGYLLRSRSHNRA